MRCNEPEKTCRTAVLLKNFLTVLQHEKGKQIVDLLIYARARWFYAALVYEQFSGFSAKKWFQKDQKKNFGAHL